MLRIKELIEQIYEADYSYYNTTPIISDKKYDALKDELRELIKNCTDKELIESANKLFNKIGNEIKAATEWKKVAHQFPMSSLNKVNTPDELNKWASDCCNNADNLFLTDKLDGISINTVWKDGKLNQAITRGDGKVGEDITQNVKKMKEVPQELNISFTGSLRGEIILKKSDHKKYFPEYANARNAASGIAKRYDGKGSEHLTILFYEVIGDKKFNTEIEQFEFIKSIGAKIPSFKLCENTEQVINIWNEYKEKIRANLDYDIDGLVIRVNNLNAQKALGEKNHRPKGAVAFKFDAEARETILRSVILQVGNTGRITPVAIFDPIDLAGVKVKQASLHNIKNINKLGIDVGAKIIVSRRNDVIPYVEEVSESTGSTLILSNKCPSCNSETEMLGEYLICPNKIECPAQALGKLKIWIKVNNILEFGPKIIQKIVEANLVSDIPDLYNLQMDELCKLERMGKKSAQNLIDVMEKHKEVPLEKFIGGLGINGISTTTVKTIIDAGYKTLQALQDITVSQLENINGFGNITAKAFCEGMAENKGRIDAILACGVHIKDFEQSKVIQNGALTNLSFCFTGAMVKTRAQLSALAEQYGGIVKDGVKTDLDYLVIADLNSTSSKAQKARKLGIKLISEEDFLKMTQ